MKWYIIAKAFLLIVASEGPFESKGECTTVMNEKVSQALAAYQAGRRIYFQGIELSPSNVKVRCELRKAD